MPLKGGYLDLEHKDMAVCSLQDIDEGYEDYQAKLKEERESGERAGDQLAPWEVQLVRQEQHAQRLLDTVRAGGMTARKFSEKMEKLRETGYLYEEDFERDTPDPL